MSHYTNDIDTLRQLVSQALPALIQSGAIVLVVFSIMLYFSLWLTLVLVLGIIAMVAVTKKIGGGSAKYFVRQQKAVASTEGFIRGDDGGSEGRQGLLPRAEEHRGLRPAQRRPL